MLAPKYSYWPIRIQPPLDFELGLPFPLVGEGLEVRGKQAPSAPSCPATSLEAPKVAERAGWGARSPTGDYRYQQPNLVTVHHAAGLWWGSALAPKTSACANTGGPPDWRASCSGTAGILRSPLVLWPSRPSHGWAAFKSLASRSMSAGTFGFGVCPTSPGREASCIHLKAPVEHDQARLHPYCPYVLWTRLAPRHPVHSHSALLYR
jgi:hypothetical protein